MFKFPRIEAELFGVAHFRRLWVEHGDDDGVFAGDFDHSVRKRQIFIEVKRHRRFGQFSGVRIELVTYHFFGGRIDIEEFETIASQRVGDFPVGA